MKKFGLLINNLIFGVIVVSVWFWDFHIKERAQYKIGKGVLEEYKGIREQLREENKEVFEESKCGVLKYKPDDVFYLTFINFKSLKQKEIDLFTSKLEEVYEQFFEGTFRLKVYVKNINIKANNMLSLVDDLEQDFYSIHTKSHNKYEIYFYKEFFDNQIVKKEDKMFIRTSKEKLSDVDFINKTINRSIFYFKNIKELLTKEDIKQKNISKAFSQLSLLCLKEKAINYISSLNYINGNNNLVFFEKYLKQIEEEPSILYNLFKEKNLFAIHDILLKSDFYIYDTVYMYEDY